MSRSIHHVSPFPKRGKGLVLNSSLNPLNIVKKELGLQSRNLPDEVREKVENAVERLGYRVTAGDAAAVTGLKLADNEAALKALAFDTSGTLEVSKDGEVVYILNKGFRETLRARSVMLRLRAAGAPVLRALQWLMRASVAATLVTSLVVVWVTIIVLMTSGGRSDDRNRGHGGGVMFMPNPFDVLFYMDTSNRRRRDPYDMSFVDSVFSFVFGDGDPNATFEERRSQALAELIKSKGGVVTAEEMAPFLDPPEPSTSQTSTALYADESFVLPALIKFGGNPIVSSDGHLLYSFPALQRTGVTATSTPRKVWNRFRKQWRDEGPTSPSTAAVLESKWRLTAASATQLIGPIALGIANLVGVMFLSKLAAQYAPQLILMRGYAWLPNTLPVLGAYAVAFFAIPAVRWLLYGFRNAAIDERNEAREEAALALQSGRVAAAKLAEARKLGRSQEVVSPSDIVFTTAQDAGEQGAVLELDDWDTRFKGN